MRGVSTPGSSGTGPHGRSPKKATSDTIGGNFVTFAAIGAGLYFFAGIFDIKFERFIFMVFILGSLIKVAQPGFNPNWSRYVRHNLSNEQITVVRSFLQSREELGEKSDKREKERIMANMRHMSRVGLERMERDLGSN